VGIVRQASDQASQNTSMGSSIVQSVKCGLTKQTTDAHAVITN